MLKNVTLVTSWKPLKYFFFQREYNFKMNMLFPKHAKHFYFIFRRLILLSRASCFQWAYAVKILSFKATLMEKSGMRARSNGCFYILFHSYISTNIPIRLNFECILKDSSIHILSVSFFGFDWTFLWII